ncbi:MAG: hypothetical protein QOF89_3443 [Acidobacteriota bacterium]|jgi:hypothetical protein|nr:hypothetical protein [Acidobacteriota bacterium]
MLARYERQPDPPNKEKLPEIRPLARHPWELTLREFIETVWSNYGIRVDYPSAARAAGLFLSEDRRIFPVVVLDEDEIMPIPLLRSLCRLYRVPAEDFGLPSEDDD